MKRHFSAITPQHAPVPRAAWHASALGAKTACTIAQPMTRGSKSIARAATRTVASPISQFAKRLPRIQAIAPPVRRGAGRGAMGWKIAAIGSALLDGRAAVVPVHESGSRERRREEDRHDDRDAFHRAAGVVERRVR